MNVGHEEEELKPYIEPEPDFSDNKRIGQILLLRCDPDTSYENIVAW